MFLLLPLHADVHTIMMDPLGALYIAVDDSLMAISDADYCGCHDTRKGNSLRGLVKEQFRSVDVLCVLRKS
jgi:hypothetical protein